MAEDDVIGTVAQQAGEFAGLWQLVTASESLQVALGALVFGLLGIAVAYRKFSKRFKSRKISYVRPHLSKFIMVLVMPLFAIVLFSSINAYIQFFELFSAAALGTGTDAAATETFARILNSVNVLVVGYTAAQLIPIILNKRTKSILEREDFASWRGMRGFRDDDGDLFYRLFRWNPPAHAPSEIAEEEFAEKLKTEEGRRSLEAFHTSKGLQIGSYTKLTDDHFEEWKKSERDKYNRYLEGCLSGNNESGHKLKMGQDPEEIYPIDTWREEKRVGGFWADRGGLQATRLCVQDTQGSAQVDRPDTSHSDLFGGDSWRGELVGGGSVRAGHGHRRLCHWAGPGATGDHAELVCVHHDQKGQDRQRG